MILKEKNLDLRFYTVEGEQDDRISIWNFDTWNRCIDALWNVDSGQNLQRTGSRNSV